jgi:hypothetical protein
VGSPRREEARDGVSAAGDPIAGEVRLAGALPCLWSLASGVEGPLSASGDKPGCRFV